MELPQEQLQRLKALRGNGTCCDCPQRNPTWCSVSFGILLCLECSGKHRGLGTHIDFVRSLEMDHFTQDQIDLLLVGGNATCQEYLHPKDTNATTRSIYDSFVAQAYKDWLKAKAKGKEEDQARLYEQLLQEQKKQQASNATSTKQPQPTTTRRVDFINKTPTPSFVSRFLTAWKFIQGKGVDTMGPLAYGAFMVGAAFMCVLLCYKLEYVGMFDWTSRIIMMVLSTTWLLAWNVVVPWYMAIQFGNQRIPAFKSAVNDFSDRVYSGRAKRNPTYDILFPPGVGVGDQVKCAMVFYPGLLVDFMAYSKVLGQVSDQGILVVLVNTEPTRVPHRSAGYTATHFQSIVHEIQTLLGIQVDEWAIGGHSLGANTAAYLAALKLPLVQKCVLWASGHRTQASQRLLLNWQQQHRIHLLTMEATKDQVLLESSTSLLLRLLLGGTVRLHHLQALASAERNPQTTTRPHVMIIPGGSHAGFGHMEAPSHWDAIREITLDEEHEQIVNKTANFLLSSRKQEPQVGGKKKD